MHLGVGTGPKEEARGEVLAVHYRKVERRKADESLGVDQLRSDVGGAGFDEDGHHLRITMLGRPMNRTQAASVHGTQRIGTSR